jgi:probable O-glycosylation ligase (exosortase A-associated)
MRDAALLLLLLAPVPVALFRPWIGVLGYTLVSIMSPHKLGWGVAHDFPFAQAYAIAIFGGLLFAKEVKRIPINGVTTSMILLVVWMCVTSAFAIYPELIGPQFSKVMKVQLMLFVILLILNSRERIEQLLWVITLSIAFWGVKGGLYVLRTGGDNRVYGPAGGFFPENNALAVVAVMSIPLMYYMYRHIPAHWFRQSVLPWIKRGLLGAMGISAVAVLGTHSRGGLLAIAAMCLLLVARSRYKLLTLIVVVLLGAGLVALMPAHWLERMHTIETYQEDSSAMERINAWSMAWNLALDRFLGAGFYTTTQELFDRYAAYPHIELQAAHSIYFQILGEHGFVGLGLFLAIWAFAWRTCSWLRQRARGNPSVGWAGDLGGMIQASLAGYLVGGAFLNLAYFDMPYMLALLAMTARSVVERELSVAKSVPSGRPGLPPLAHG